ncbi:hypothetical protein EV368DRAFT_85421 [Lentinula lateritia]|nr:hypothetical protein EV368DRAFT_85421 [Lentinula lateritia]
MNSNRVSSQVASDQHDGVAFNGPPPVTPTASQQRYPTYMYGYPYGYLPTPIEPSVHQTSRIPFPRYPSHTAIPNPAAFISPTRALLASTQPLPSKSHKCSYDEDITFHPNSAQSGSLLSDNEVADEDEEIDQLDEMSAFSDDLVIQETQPHDDNDFELDNGEWPPSPGCLTLDNGDSGCYDASPSPTYVNTEPLPTIPTPPMSSAPQSSTKLKKPPLKVSKKNSGVSVATASSELLTKQSGYLDEHVAQSRIQLVLLRDKEKREAVREEERLALEKRREEREQQEQLARREMDKQRLEREAEQWEYQKKLNEMKQVMEKDKQRFDAAQAVLWMPNITETLKDAANNALLSILHV